MSYLKGIANIQNLGALNPYTSMKMRGKSQVLDNVLKQIDELKGLGATENKKLSFEEVMAKYNAGITEPEIKAWVWYKQHQGIPMTGWEAYHLEGTGRVLLSQLHTLVRQGALFYHAGEMMPFPIYTYGNMYDRLAQLETDKKEILEYFGEEVYEQHKQALEKAKPELLTVENPDDKERPIITAISDFAINPDLFSITGVREEFMDLENSEELRKVNGKVERKKDSEKIRIRFDGDTKYTLQNVFVKWLLRSMPIPTLKRVHQSTLLITTLPTRHSEMIALPKKRRRSLEQMPELKEKSFFKIPT